MSDCPMCLGTNIIQNMIKTRMAVAAQGDLMNVVAELEELRREEIIKQAAFVMDRLSEVDHGFREAVENGVPVGFRLFPDMGIEVNNGINPVPLN